jgi:CubicO group peptidase (beta-lactamase class C family)
LKKGKMLKKLLIFIGVLTLITPSFSQRRGTPTQADTLNNINSFVLQMMAEWKIPATSITIVKDGKPYSSFALGLKNTQKNIPNTVNTLFPIASCTKSFTAAALAILVDEGKLDWNKPIKEYMPDFQLYDDEATRTVTARDILSHRTGLPRHDYVWLFANNDRKTIFENLKYLKPSKPLYAQYQYNNLMYMVAGVLVERLSGKTWESFVKEKILLPLDMNSTVLNYSEMFRSPDYAMSYKSENEQLVEVGFGSNIDAIGSAGSIKSNALDMTNWLVMQLQNGQYNGKKIVSEKNLRENHTPVQVVFPAEAKYPELGFSSYGMGWNMNVYRGQQRRQHNGSIEGFRSQMTIFPNNQLGIFVTTNTSTADYYYVNIITNFIADNLLNMSVIDWNSRLKKERDDAKFEEEKKKKEHDASRKMGAMMSHPIDYYAGIYEHPAYGVLQVFKTDKGLRAVYHNKQVELAHFHYDYFEGTGFLEGITFQFMTNQKGDIDKITATFPNAGDVDFKRK